MSSRRFELVQGSSSKFWEIAVEGKTHTVRFGKIGTAGQTKKKSFDTPAAAEADAEELVSEKTKKGYCAVSNRQAPPPRPIEPDWAEDWVPAGTSLEARYQHAGEGKFWEAAVGGPHLVVHAGSFGAVGSVVTTKASSEALARFELFKLRKKLEEAGYEAVSISCTGPVVDASTGDDVEGSPSSPGPSSDSLEELGRSFDADDPDPPPPPPPRKAPVGAPDLRALEAKLGIPLGNTLRSLIERAYALSPIALPRTEPLHRPEDAFRYGAYLVLPWIGPDAPRDWYRAGYVPKDVLFFCGDHRRYGGFWMGGGRDISTDERPIVWVEQQEEHTRVFPPVPLPDPPPAHVIAPNLAAFLALVAFRGAIGLRRGAPDEEWFKLREDLLPLPKGERTDPKDRMARKLFTKDAKELLKVKGVTLPEHPCALTLAAEDIAFEYDPPKPPPRERFISTVHKNDPSLRLGDAERQLAAGHFDLAAQSARVASRDRAAASDALFVLVQALRQLGPRDHRDELVYVARRWLAGSMFVRAQKWAALAEALELAGGIDPELLGDVRSRA